MANQKKINVKLTGGVLGPEDIIEFDGHRIPMITGIKITSDIDGPPRLDIFTICPEADIKVDPKDTVIHRLAMEGATIENYESLLKERDALKEQCKLLKRQLNDGNG